MERESAPLGRPTVWRPERSWSRSLTWLQWLSLALVPVTAASEFNVRLYEGTAGSINIGLRRGGRQPPCGSITQGQPHSKSSKRRVQIVWLDRLLIA